MVKQCKLLEVNRSSLYYSRAGVSLEDEETMKKIDRTHMKHPYKGSRRTVTAGWGYCGQGNAVVPGQGTYVERPFTQSEHAGLGDKQSALGETTFDVYLNARAFWSNVPHAVWTYRLGGYQVLKKWLSYREHGVLDRALSPTEVQHFSDMARRIEAMILTGYLNAC